MPGISRPARTTRLIAIALGSVVSVATLLLPSLAAGSPPGVQHLPEGWLIKVYGSVELPAISIAP